MIPHLEYLMAYSSTKPAVNQAEFLYMYQDCFWGVIKFNLNPIAAH